MRKMYFVLSVLLLTVSARGQTTVYQEDFSNQNGKGAIGNSNGQVSLDLSNVNWDIDISQCSLTANTDWLLVANNQLEARDIDGEAYWYSPSIPLQSGHGYGISLQASESGSLESSDYLISEFRVDAGAWQLFSTNGYLYDDFSTKTVSHFGIQGDSLRIRVRLKNNATTEYLRFDDLSVYSFSELVFANGNWNRMPDPYSGVLNARVSAGSQVVISQDATVNDLIIEPGASVVIDSAISLVVLSDILNDGVLNIASGAALVQEKTTNGNSGTGIVHVSKNYYCPDHLRFSYWSSPVQNAQIENVFASTNPLDRYSFEAASQSFTNYSSGPLLEGKAYICTPSTQGSTNLNPFYDNRTFSGELNNGSITYSLTGVQAGDWVLLGNPYPCPIDFQAFIADNPDLLNSVHFWDASTPHSNGAAYAIWNAAGVNPVPFSNRANPSRYIASMQGFMVQIGSHFNQSNLNVSFNNAMRRTLQTGAPHFYKKEMKQHKIWLSLGDSVSRRRMLLCFSEAASVDFDSVWDAQLTFEDRNRFALFSISNDQKALAIQTQGPLSPGEERIIPLGMSNGIISNASLSIDSVEDAGLLQVEIYDQVENKVIKEGLGAVPFPNLNYSATYRYVLKVRSLRPKELALGEELESSSRSLLSFKQGNWELKPSSNSFLTSVQVANVDGIILRQESDLAKGQTWSCGSNQLPQGVLIIYWCDAITGAGTARIFNINP